MKKIIEYQIRKTKLNFSSSEQPNPDVNQLYSDDCCLMNAIELIDLEDLEETQLLVCEHCGITQCASGDWVRIRRILDSIVFIPDFGKLLSEDEWERTEYTPPKFMEKIGIPYFSSHIYNQIKTLVNRLPEINDVPELTFQEAIECFKYEAPLKLLGDVQKINKPKYDLIIASEGFEKEKAISILRKVIDYNHINENGRAEILRIDDSWTATELIIDSNEITTWKPLTSKNKIGLILSDEFALDITEKVQKIQN